MVLVLLWMNFAETEGCTELHTTDSKEKSITADYTECLKNQKVVTDIYILYI